MHHSLGEDIKGVYMETEQNAMQKDVYMET